MGPGRRADITLVTSHLAFGRALARRFQRPGVDADDLEQVAALGLLLAAERFDPERGVPFSAFARITIEGELRRYLRDHAAPVRRPRTLHDLDTRVAAAEDRLRQRLQREATHDEIAEHLGCDPQQVAEAVASRAAWSCESLDAAVHDRAAETDVTEPLERRELVAMALIGVAERERLLLQLRYGREQTQSEIADQVGISQVHVSRLLRRTLERVRRHLARLDDAHGARVDDAHGTREPGQAA